jgi:diguanylate cyclase (GGDEF)-like protein/PAS domain S-box-containing protein/putative nucleotidyltransferase with HDIG domain
VIRVPGDGRHWIASEFATLRNHLNMTKQLISAPFTITISLAFVLIGVLLLALMLGMAPDGSQALARNRIALCETIAVNTSLAIQRKDKALIEEGLAAAVSRNTELLRVAIVRKSGELMYATGSQPSGAMPVDTVTVPLASNGESWGTAQLFFQPLNQGQLGAMNTPTLRLVSFIGALGFLIIYIYLKRVLQHLDPTKVIPQRVRTTLDTLAEGLVVIDENQTIVLANNAFAELLGEAPEEMVGREIRDLPWTQVTDDYPWSMAIASGQVNTGSVIRMLDRNGEARTFRVNSAPIIGEDGNCQGALTSFDDVTALEERTLALTEMLERLKTSRDQIRQQNETLHVLATRDPLTSALNRRSFFELIEPIWTEAVDADFPLCCAMVDIDHFKGINDNHGHAMGDFVLKATVAILLEESRDYDIVCRYGGEEFCVVFPKTDIDAAMAITERFREAIEAFDFNGLKITTSFGVSSIEMGATDFARMQDQADQALFFAKRTGRNRVRRFDKIPADFDLQSTPDEGSQREDESKPEPIPVETVSCLLSALAYRDIGTAEHSRRVANLCVRMADGLIKWSDSYILENAALLHDIGKIGVPDHVLLKPGNLTDEEWEIMRAHDDISVEIIRSTFVCEELTEIVRTHHAWFDGNPNDPDLPTGEDIPIGSRILAIADSYDAMVSDRVYRKGRSKEEAMAELRKCAGTQFDPHLVERFVALVSRQEETLKDTAAIPDKQIALKLGVEIESLAKAIDDQDRDSLRMHAEIVRATAEACSLAPAVQLTSEVLESIDSEDEDWLNTLELAIDLIEMCRMAQWAHLDTTAAQQTSSSMTKSQPIESICV